VVSGHHLLKSSVCFQQEEGVEVDVKNRANVVASIISDLSFLLFKFFYLWKMFVEIGSFFGFYPKREEELKYCFLKEEVYYV